MATRSRTPELRFDLSADHSDLLRAFVREASLAEGVSLSIASLITDAAALVWRALCARQARRDPASVAVSTQQSSVTVKFILTGHDRFSRIMPSLFQGLPDDVGFSYRERGIDGWEIILHASLQAFSPIFHSLEEAEESSSSRDDFQIDLPVKEDSAAIGRCFLQVYGHHYVHSEVFSPRRYWSKVEAGELVPVIARNSQGEVVGHVALEREHGAQIAERGQAVVLPSYRGRHLLEKMTERLSKEATKLGLEGVFAQPVTIHTFSQRNDERAGMPICAIMLGILPENVLPKGQAAPTAGQRQSLLLTFRFLKKPAARLVNAPAAYREIIAGIYASLGVRISAQDRAETATEESKVQIRMDRNGAARIDVSQIGSGIETELKQAFKDVMGFGSDYVQLSAPMSAPGLPLLSDAARSIGFFFCGVGPAFATNDDVLLLQYLNQPLDTGKLQIFADRAKEILKFIEQDRHSATGSGRAE